MLGFCWNAIGAEMRVGMELRFCCDAILLICGSDASGMRADSESDASRMRADSEP